jgi:hypothetical protein
MYITTLISCNHQSQQLTIITSFNTTVTFFGESPHDTDDSDDVSDDDTEDDFDDGIYYVDYDDGINDGSGDVVKDGRGHSDYLPNSPKESTNIRKNTPEKILASTISRFNS